MNAISIDYRRLSFDTLAKIIELANQDSTTPDEAARRYLTQVARDKTPAPHRTAGDAEAAEKGAA